jgi:hypothetical protein
MNVRKGLEWLSFDDAIASERDRLAKHPDILSVEWRRSSYLTRGAYAAQLVPWMNLFPKDQLMILRSEDYFNNPHDVLQHIQEYLDLQPHQLTETAPHHAQQYTPLDPLTRCRIENYFESYNRLLAELLNRDMGWANA